MLCMILACITGNHVQQQQHVTLVLLHAGSPRSTPRMAQAPPQPPNPSAQHRRPDTPSQPTSPVASSAYACHGSKAEAQSQMQSEISRSSTPTFIPPDYEEDKKTGPNCARNQTSYAVVEVGAVQKQRQQQPRPPPHRPTMAPPTPFTAGSSTYAVAAGAACDTSPETPRASTVAVHNITSKDAAVAQLQLLKSVASMESPLPNPLCKYPCPEPSGLASSPLKVKLLRVEDSVCQPSIAEYSKTSTLPHADITARRPFEASPFEVQSPSFLNGPSEPFNPNPTTPAKQPQPSPHTPQPNTPPPAPPVATLPMRFATSCPHAQSPRSSSLQVSLRPHAFLPPMHYNCTPPDSREYSQLQCHAYAAHGDGVAQWNLADGLAPAPESVNQPSYALSSVPVSPAVSQPGSRGVSRAGSQHLSHTQSPPLSGNVRARPSTPQTPTTLPISTMPCHTLPASSVATDLATIDTHATATHTHTEAGETGLDHTSSAAQRSEHAQQLAHLRNVICAAWAPCIIADGTPSNAEALSELAAAAAALAETGVQKGVACDPLDTAKAAASIMYHSTGDCATVEDVPVNTLSPAALSKPGQTQPLHASSNSNLQIPPKFKRVPMNRQGTPHPSEAYLPSPAPDSQNAARPPQPPLTTPTKPQSATAATTPPKALLSNSPSYAQSPITPEPSDTMKQDTPILKASQSSAIPPLGAATCLEACEKGCVQGSAEHSRICKKILENISHCTVAEAAQAIRSVDNALKLLLEVNRSCMHGVMADQHPPESTHSTKKAACESQKHHSKAFYTGSECKDLSARYEAAKGVSGGVDGIPSTHMRAMHVSCVAEPDNRTPQDILATMCSSNRSGGSWDPMLASTLTALTAGATSLSHATTHSLYFWSSCFYFSP